jgi:hypothetical protein
MRFTLYVHPHLKKRVFYPEMGKFEMVDRRKRVSSTAIGLVPEAESMDKILRYIHRIVDID